MNKKQSALKLKNHNTMVNNLKKAIKKKFKSSYAMALTELLTNIYVSQNKLNQKKTILEVLKQITKA
jgi:adenylyl- and sulfurtransferase ThiI